MKIGKIPTAASFIRDFILNHPEYNNDSLINMRVCYDLLKRIADITKHDNYMYKWSVYCSIDIMLNDIFYNINLLEYCWFEYIIIPKNE